MLKPSSDRLWRCVQFYLYIHAAFGRSPDTLRSKKGNLKHFCKWCFANNIFRVSKVTMEIMYQYAAFVNTYRKPLDNKPLSDAHKYNLLSEVRLFIKRMHMNELVDTNTLEFFELPKKGRSLPKALFNEQEVLSILKQPSMFGISGFRDQTIMEVLFATGIRRSECAYLDIGDITIDPETLRGIVRVNRGKGKKERLVPISSRAGECVILYLQKVRHSIDFSSMSTALFVDNQGKRFLPNKLSEMVGKYVKLAGLKRGGACHLFRHAAATFMLKNGADLRYIQEFLGHADISTTQMYTHLDIQQLCGKYHTTHPSALRQR